MTAHSDRIAEAADLLASADIRLEAYRKSKATADVREGTKDRHLAEIQTAQAGGILLLAIAQSLAGIHNEMQTARRKR